METLTYSVDKACEGGMGQKTAIELLKMAGLKAKPGYSPYVGQTGVKVEANKTGHKKASKILYGR
jgi:hypothetical protein